MFVELYDKNGLHLGNLNHVSYEFTKRVYDFDTGSFQGTSSFNVESSYIFCLMDGSVLVYSGFVKNLKQQGDLVRFSVDDFRIVFDTDILLDYTSSASRLDPNKYQVQGVFLTVWNALFDGSEINATIPADTQDASWIGTYDGTYLVENALDFLKVYLGYYAYYIKSYYDRSSGTIEFEFVKNTTSYSIKLEDFLFDTTMSVSKINHTIATIEYNTDKGETLYWAIYSNQEVFDNCPVDKQFETLVVVSNPAAVTIDAFDPFTDPSGLGICHKLNIYRTGFYPGTPERIMYVEYVKAWNARPSMAYREYYLGNDNNIYANTIDSSKKILPTRTKIFEADYLAKAQQSAVYELVSNRFVESILLTATRTPLDLYTLNLYDMLTVYDSAGVVRTLPVSEIHNDNGEVDIKLGFKKTLLTEIIK